MVKNLCSLGEFHMETIVMGGWAAFTGQGRYSCPAPLLSDFPRRECVTFVWHHVSGGTTDRGKILSSGEVLVMIAVIG